MMRRKKCRGLRDYSCLDGGCTYNWRSCRSVDHENKCTSKELPFYCPTIDICTTSDKDCLRTCGTVNQVYKYEIPCVGFDKCASAWYDCPRVCLRHRCHDGRCVDSEWQCEPHCMSWRCKNGQCLRYFRQRCDGVPDCSDHSDEEDCGPNVYTPKSGDSSRGMFIGLTMVCVISVLIVICLVLCCRFRSLRTRRGNGRSSRSGMTPVPRTARPAFYSEPYERRDNWRATPLLQTTPLSLLANQGQPSTHNQDAPPAYVPPSPAYLANLQPTAPSVNDVLHEEPPTYDDVIKGNVIQGEYKVT